MKRPLAWVCLVLAVAAILQLFFCGSMDREGIRRKLLLEEENLPGERLRVSGRVCGIEEKTDRVYIWLQRKGESFFPETEVHSLKGDSDDQNSVVQSAAFLQRIDSCMRLMRTDKIRCAVASQDAGRIPAIGGEATVEGVFAFCQEATNPGEFNAGAYYQGLGIGAVLWDAQIVWSDGGVNWLKNGLFRLKKRLSERLGRLFPEREAGVIRTMLLGDRSVLDAELKELYREGGILHILSISGLHVTLLGMGLFRILRRMGVPLGPAAVISGFFLLLYGMMTGMSVSACRAIGMFLIRMLAALWGRTYDLLTALSLLAALMLCTEPLHVMQSGFWLSFGALAGTGILLPVLEEMTEGLLGERGRAEHCVMRFLGRLGAFFRDGILAGASVLLATLPMLLFIYYEVPVYSMLVNLFVIPAMGVVIFIGFFVMLVPGMGFLSILDVILLRCFEVLCRQTHKLPFSVWRPGCPEIWQIVLYYLILAGVLGFFRYRFRHGRKPSGKWLGCALTAGVILPVMILGLPHKGTAEAVFLDVGQGDCAFLRGKGGSVWILDGGSTSKKAVGEQVILPFLKSQGVTVIEGIFLSHADQDHINGVEELLQSALQEEIQIRRLILPRLGGERTDLAFEKVLEKAAGIPGLEIWQMEAGDRLHAEGVDFLALHPVAGDAERLSSNEASLCILAALQAGKRELSLLFTGDVEGEGEKLLLAEMRERGVESVDVLKCAHHGSKNATSEQFLGQLNAEICVISCGRNNVYGHPHQETLDRLLSDGSRILRTDKSGAVSLRYDGRICRVREFRRVGRVD